MMALMLYCEQICVSCTRNQIDCSSSDACGNSLLCVVRMMEPRTVGLKYTAYPFCFWTADAGGESLLCVVCMMEPRTVGLKHKSAVHLCLCKQCQRQAKITVGSPCVICPCVIWKLPFFHPISTVYLCLCKRCQQRAKITVSRPSVSPDEQSTVVLEHNLRCTCALQAVPATSEG
eukprot:383172-Pelagomonas_calceolata.AAC.7